MELNISQYTPIIANHFFVIEIRELTFLCSTLVTLANARNVKLDYYAIVWPLMYDLACVGPTVQILANVNMLKFMKMENRQITTCLTTAQLLLFI